MFTCQYFKAHEFIPPHIYNKWGERSFMFIDDRILKMMDYIRENIGAPITINNYKWNGDRQWSGLRTPDSPWYSELSQHSFGRAVDFLVKGYTPQEVHVLLDKWLRYSDEFRSIVTSITVEEYKDGGITWVHIDIRNASEGMNIFYV